MNFFITGTDTDCGKTYVTSLLVRSGREDQLDIIGVKPICCGSWEDVELLSAANGDVESLSAINPIWFKTAGAPLTCTLLGEPVPDFESALAAVRMLSFRHKHVLCEGVGGWKVPLKKGYYLSDFATELGWPVIIVARNKLGVLSHTFLTVESVLASGLQLGGVILNNADDLENDVLASNAQAMEEMLGFPILTQVPYGAQRIVWPRAFPTIVS